jgi:hypothetical protein
MATTLAWLRRRFRMRRTHLGEGIAVGLRRDATLADQEEAVGRALRWNAERTGELVDDRKIKEQARRLIEMKARAGAQAPRRAQRASDPTTRRNNASLRQ